MGTSHLSWKLVGNQFQVSLLRQECAGHFHLMALLPSHRLKDSNNSRNRVTPCFFSQSKKFKQLQKQNPTGYSIAHPDALRGRWFVLLHPFEYKKIFNVSSHLPSGVVEHFDFVADVIPIIIYYQSNTRKQVICILIIWWWISSKCEKVLKSSTLSLSTFDWWGFRGRFWKSMYLIQIVQLIISNSSV